MKNVTTLASVIFGIVALAHASRLAFRFDVIVAGWSVPLWVNAIALLLAGYLCVGLWKLRTR